MVLFTGCMFVCAALLTWYGMNLYFTHRDERLRERLRGDTLQGAIDRSLIERIEAFWEDALLSAGGLIMPKAREGQAALRRRLGYAGLYSSAAVGRVLGWKVLLTAGGVVSGGLAGWLAGNAAAGISIGGVAGYMLPNLWLAGRIKGQRQVLDRALPDALDLMVVCVEAGLTLDSALQRVGQELKVAHPRLSQEFEITHMETRVGLARAEAMKNLGRRTGSQALSSLATMMIQSERFGTSIATALKIHAETLRVNRQHAAEETASKATVKLSFPVVLFIFPAVLIVLAGPAIIGLLNSALFAD